MIKRVERRREDERSWKDEEEEKLKKKIESRATD